MARIIQVSDDWVEIRNDNDDVIYEGHRPPDTVHSFADVIRTLYRKVIEVESYED